MLKTLTLVVAGWLCGAAVFKEYFAQFGTIEDVVVMYDQATNRPRGFGFVTFESEEAVDRVFQVGDMHELQDKKVWCPRNMRMIMTGLLTITFGYVRLLDFEVPLVVPLGDKQVS